ncbi:unnamed protein product [Cylicostephanus goldi]|uniref:Uncharacterized protein n=1 Tax=Cylicostephanus goldi TaxID=71465 RepID=A0A3P6R305_CYLGO|nr:unnamed protein product [Cylicostephanus goldi]
MKIIRIKCKEEQKGRTEKALWSPRKEVSSGIFTINEAEAKVPVVNTSTEPLILHKEEEVSTWGTNKWYESMLDSGAMMLDSGWWNAQERDKQSVLQD